MCSIVIDGHKGVQVEEFMVNKMVTKCLLLFDGLSVPTHSEEKD